MTETILFEPLLPWPVLGLLLAAGVIAIGLAIWRNLSGWWFRLLTVLALLLALSGPVLQSEDRNPLSDIVLVVMDDTSSQHLSDRQIQTENARSELAILLEQRPNTQTRWLTMGDRTDDSGSTMMQVISDALADEPQGRVAGIIALSDGQVHDAEDSPEFPAPFHVLLSGREGDWDRRLVVRNAPAFAIIGEPITLTVRIEDQGQAPTGQDSRRAPLEISIDGAEPQRFMLPVGIDFDLPVSLPHGGQNVIRFTVPEASGELTPRNNSALVQINGIRDRLRVLLVSGEPHAGGRTWRNLLKSDSSVDLVHFTILRPPEKQDGVPVDELSLIAFPTRELFLEKISDFDLIIFDRYKRRGILPAIYLDNVVNYVSDGGAVLVSAGPDFASADSIYRSPLSAVLPASPTALVVEEAYLPTVTDIGDRHPVTADLENHISSGDNWGRWLRQIDVEHSQGHVLMTGHDKRPLLILNRVDSGRVALLASDHAWLWSRGYEGGGPQLELLRRLAHWMMKEPELEEEALWAEPSGPIMRILRRSLAPQVGPVSVTHPDGTTVHLEMTERTAGLFEAEFTGSEDGLYRLTQGDLSTVVGLGPAAPREFQETIATPSVLEPIVATTRGGILPLEQGMPTLRDIRPGRPASGRGWIGLTPREAFETLSVSRHPLLPGWLILVLVTSLLLGGWLREGRN